MSKSSTPAAKNLAFLRTACQTQGVEIALSRLKKNEHAAAVWDHDGPEIWIQWIESFRKGAGAEALRKLTAAADASGSLLRLALDDNGSGKLAGFYAQFGFVRDHAGGDICERIPSPSLDLKQSRIDELFNDRIAPNGGLAKDNFAAWFGNSRVVDGSGIPLRLFHGTDADFEAFEFSEDIGFHFGSCETANARVEQAEMESSALVAVYLSLQNPLRVRDLHTWSPRAVAREFIDLGVITEEDADEASVVDREQVAQWLQSKGFDGLVYSNVTEGGGDSFIAMHPHQIKSAVGNSGNFSRHTPFMSDSAEIALRAEAARAWVDEAISAGPSHRPTR